MGITHGGLRLLARTLKTKSLNQGSVVTYGKNGVEANYQEFLKLMALEDYELIKLNENEIKQDPITQFINGIHQDVVFKSLGFQNVHSLDFIDAENPSFMIDLNKKIPSFIQEKYDLIFDGGTTEHVFDTKQLIENTINILKPGGVVIHSVPMSGYINHGFYQFSPTFFFDTYHQNNFTELEMYFILQKFNSDYTIKQEYAMKYNPSENPNISDLNNETCCLWFSARRPTTIQNNHFEIPIQNFYQNFTPVNEKKNKQNISNDKSLSQQYTKKKISLKSIIKSIIPKSLIRLVANEIYKRNEKLNRLTNKKEALR